LKKNVIILSLILLIIIIICIVGINLNSKTSKSVLQQNSEYEQYLNKKIYGTDVITLINKATSSNETNKVLKDEKGLYIENNQNSIKIDIVMITNEEKNETTVYKMEAISKVGITEFIKNFNTATFKCTKTEYHNQTGNIKYIEIMQQDTV